MSLFTQQLGKRPELLLPLGVLLQFLFIGNTAIDIHLHDTYIVAGTYTWLNLLLQMILYSPILISWLLHRQLRKAGFPMNGWRWAQIVVTFICMALIIMFMLFSDQHAMPRRYYDYDNWASRLGPYSKPLILITIMFVTQFAFWIAAIILLFRNRKIRQQIIK